MPFTPPRPLSLPFGVNLPSVLSLSIEFNEHVSVYATIEQWEASYPDECAVAWASPKERAVALATNSVWRVLVYPDTPVGFFATAASTLEAALKAIERIISEQ